MVTGAESVDGVTLGRARRFLHAEADAWRIADALRPRVTFAVGDLAFDPPPALACDLVLCRNVLIYLTTASKRLVLERLAAALRPGGHLVLGLAESLPPDMGFAVVDAAARIYRKEGA